MQFDLKKDYQLGLFHTGFQGEVASVPELLRKQPPGGPRYSVRLRKREEGQQMVIVPGAANRVLPIVQWSGPSVWRTTLSEQRLDVHVDARGYEDISGSEMTLEQAVARMSDNLSACPSELGLSVWRLACIVTAEASTEQCPEPAKVIADRYFNDRVRGENDLLDLSARVNSSIVSPFSEGEVRINRIEHGEATWKYSSEEVVRTLRFQLDYNTSAEFRGPLSADDIRTFFEAAVSWSQEMLKEVVDAA